MRSTNSSGTGLAESDKGRGEGPATNAHGKSVGGRGARSGRMHTDVNESSSNYDHDSPASEHEPRCRLNLTIAEGVPGEGTARMLPTPRTFEQ